MRKMEILGPHWQVTKCIAFSVAQRPLVGQSLLIIEASQSDPFGHTTLGRTPLEE
jgi:hypothetical protein